MGLFALVEKTSISMNNRKWINNRTKSLIPSDILGVHANETKAYTSQNMKKDQKGLILLIILLDERISNN
jgi:hypothetical protein